MIYSVENAMEIFKKKNHKLNILMYLLKNFEKKRRESDIFS